MLTDREKTWKTAYKAMGSLLANWKNNSPDLCRRLPTRIFYEAVGSTKTGYISKGAIDNPKSVTHDHFAMPQWIGRFIMDNGDVYLTDFDKFKEIAYFASQTIKVTKEENKRLSLQTSEISKIDGKTVYIETSINNKYRDANILLWDDKEGYLTEFPIEIPDEILEYEYQFLSAGELQ